MQQQNHPKKQKITDTNGSSEVEKHGKKSGGVKTKGSSVDDGREMFEWLINPIKADDFMR